MDRTVLSFVALEDRLAPALTFRFDYSLDATGFFNDPNRRALLEQAGADLAGRISTTLAPITPGAGKGWTATFFHPTTGDLAQLPNLSVGAGELLVFAGGSQLGGSEAGEGGNGGYQANGSSAWLDTVATRGNGRGYGSWGGSLSFDFDHNWYFGADAAGLRADQTDFYTVAVHELGHVLGFGTIDAFADLDAGGTFTGPASRAAYGSNPPLSPDRAHWAQGLTSGGQPVSMQPVLVGGQRYGFSPLDYAALQDMGWTIAAANPTPTPTPAPTPVPPPVTITLPPTNPSELLPAVGPERVVSLTGPADGSGRLFELGDNGRLTPLGQSVTPFLFGGATRSAAGDLNGDGTADLVFAAGPGGGSALRFIDGATFADLAPQFSAFERSFTGGLHVAAADLDADGRDEVVISPDQGGGGRVTVLKVENGTARAAANFFGIDDQNFRGGARVAATDVNGDGRADLVVGAGFGGGPRVSIFDGRTVFDGAGPRRLVSDFFAFDGQDVSGLRNGVFVAGGDLNGDGRADLVFGGGPGGGPRVLAVSGGAIMSDIGLAMANPLANFFAFDAAERGGVRPGVRDVDGDGRNDLIVGSGEKVPATIKIYRGATAIWGDREPGTPITAEPFGNTPVYDGVYVG